ncbi:MAG: hypothetical protein JXB48_21250 [Candidatus Latescibacteria bacterium]|nr:hypothetical protein [Candidatus Latescibacterota bacterium]
MRLINQYLIGGQRLRELGSDRHTDDCDWLVNSPDDDRLFIHAPDGDYINASAHPLYAEIWAEEIGNDEQVTVTGLLNMCVFAFVQHCENGFWDKADAKEYDIKFLARKFNARNFDIAKKYISSGAAIEVQKILDAVIGR